MSDYSIWNKRKGTWTSSGHLTHGYQDPKSPFRLTKVQVESWWKTNNFGDHIDVYEIRPIDGEELPTIEAASGAVINNCTCPTCKNNKCNKAEINCWWCGNKL